MLNLFSNDGGIKKKVKYIGDYYKVCLEKNKEYEAKLNNDGFLEIYIDAMEDVFQFTPEQFEIVEAKEAQ